MSNLFFQGLAIGLQSSKGDMVTLFLAVMMHIAQVYNLRQKTTTTATGDDAQGHHGIQPRAQHRSKQPLGENLEYEAENCLTKDYQIIV